MEWTAERVATLRAKWAEGLSASQIARELGGGATRNSVIGKVHRLRMTKRVTPTKTFRPKRRRPAACDRIAGPKIKDKPLPTPTPAPIPPLNVPILDVSPFQCRAVVDTTEWGNAKLCGHVVAEGSWCAAHAAMFFNLVERKRAA